MESVWNLLAVAKGLLTSHLISYHVTFFALRTPSSWELVGPSNRQWRSVVLFGIVIPDSTTGTSADAELNSYRRADGAWVGIVHLVNNVWRNLTIINYKPFQKRNVGLKLCNRYNSVSVSYEFSYSTSDLTYIISWTSADARGYSQPWLLAFVMRSSFRQKRPSRSTVNDDAEATSVHPTTSYSSHRLRSWAATL